MAEATCYRTNFPYASPANKNGAFSYIVLCVMRLTNTRGLIRFSNCSGLSRLIWYNVDDNNGLNSVLQLVKRTYLAFFDRGVHICHNNCLWCVEITTKFLGPELKCLLRVKDDLS